jgi:hypothetical protein
MIRLWKWVREKLVTERFLQVLLGLEYSALEALVVLRRER